jgi:hypothetical protein
MRWSTCSLAFEWPLRAPMVTFDWFEGSGRLEIVTSPERTVPRTSIAWSRARAFESKRTEIMRRRCGVSMLARARRISSRLRALVRTISWLFWPVSTPPGSTKGCSTGNTWSTVR